MSKQKLLYLREIGNYKVCFSLHNFLSLSYPIIFSVNLNWNFSGFKPDCMTEVFIDIIPLIDLTNLLLLDPDPAISCLKHLSIIIAIPDGHDSEPETLLSDFYHYCLL